jgi:hypothetical protein
MTPICAIIVGPPLSATQHQRLDGCAPLRRVVLGHRQLRDAGRRVAQGAELSAISGSGIGSSNGRDQALAAITAASCVCRKLDSAILMVKAAKDRS